VTFVNAAARRLLGRDNGAIAAGWADAEGTPLSPGDLPLVRATGPGEAIIDGEWQVTRPDGRIVLVQGSATPVVAGDGTRLGAVLTLRDVTARRALEREREEFFANAAHDLRTPLAAIKAAIGVVLANEPPGTLPPIHRMLTNIDRAATEMGRLVDDLLELGRLQRGRATSAATACDLRTIVARAGRAIEPLAQDRGQQLIVTLPPDPVPVLADAPRIERVLLNLLGNAQKYGRDGGRIALRVERLPGEAVVSVADDGPGIPLEDQSRLFERFYRSHAASSRRIIGSGLGLPIVKTLVELHGGRVAVESAPGAGATFRLTLPLAQALRSAEPQGLE
jgi:signal transduction histidine kinase